MNDEKTISIASLVGWVSGGKPDCDLTRNESDFKAHFTSLTYLFEPIDISLTLNLLTEKGYSWSLTSADKAVRYSVYRAGPPRQDVSVRSARSLSSAICGIMCQIIDEYECFAPEHKRKPKVQLRLDKLAEIRDSGKRFAPQYSLKHLRPDELDEIINLPIESTIMVRDKGNMTRVW